jgi:hypothetical protein
VGTEGQAGLVLAPNQGGLTASVPVGPRFTAKPATGVLGAPQDLVRRLASTPRDIKVIGQPTEITFGATKGLAITTQALRGGHSIVSEEVVVPVGPERAYTLVLEAPANQWSSEQRSFTGILHSVTFNSSAVPIARGG